VAFLEAGMYRGQMVAVSTSHPAILEIFKGSDFGAGGHAHILARLAGAGKAAQIRFGPGCRDRVSLIPIEHFFAVDPGDVAAVAEEERPRPPGQDGEDGRDDRPDANERGPPAH
jgi:hypothetical protein